MSRMLKIAANISVLFRELPVRERFRAARVAGFDGVEMQFPYAEAPRNLARAAEAAGSRVILINGPILAGTHPFGIAGRPDLRESFRAQLPQICEYAEALKVHFVHILAGTTMAPDEGAQCWDTYVDNLLFAADALSACHVQVLIEPLNVQDAPGYLLHSLSDAQMILDRCGGRVGLQFDAYHVARMGLDPAEEFMRMAPAVRHVQFADAPGRHEPGTGEIPFKSFLAALERYRYEGWMSAEYVPLSETRAGLAWLKQWREGCF
jgi:hydroxypyruvate isomerase